MNITVVRSLALMISLLSLGGLAAAQDEPPVFESTKSISFDRPESWALKRSASLTLFTSVAPPKNREPGSVDLALEPVSARFRGLLLATGGGSTDL